MKKLISMLVAAVTAFVAYSAVEPTYSALSWEVLGTDVVKFNGQYANVYAEVGGARIGSDARSSYDPSNRTVEATSVLLGAEGWNWGTANIQDATFKVELLNAAYGVIATSEGISYNDLLTASALDVNYSGSGVPQSHSAVQTFTNFTVSDTGVYQFLLDLFGDNASVLPITDANGVATNYIVKLAKDLTGPVQFAGNLGFITLDLYGHSIVGTNALAATTATGGNAIEILASTNIAPGTTTTQLALVNTFAAGYEGLVAGGDGADNGMGTTGGYAVYVDSSLATSSKVIIGTNMTVQAGASGNSTDGLATEGIAAVSAGVTVVGATTDGEDGTGYKAWAWAYNASYEAEDAPAGTILVGDKLYFYGYHNEAGWASFDFTPVDKSKLKDDDIHFVQGVIPVYALNVPAAMGNLNFIGDAAGTVLSNTTTKSIFTVETASDDTRVWTNLTFVGAANLAVAKNGTAINVAGGAFEVQDCSFSNFAADHLGGAICATALNGDSQISYSQFYDNATGSANGEGGAVYAGATSAGVNLLIDNCAFCDNSAVNGGAISTYTVDTTGEKPVELDIIKTVFTNNCAIDLGGAIQCEGDLMIDAEATYLTDNANNSAFVNNFAGWEGGAIAVESTVAVSTPMTLKAGRGVTFTGNVASNDADVVVAGGAIAVSIPYSTVEIEGVAFTGNRAFASGLAASDDEVYNAFGGAFFTPGYSYDKVSFDTCTFNDNTVKPLAAGGTAYYGGAVMVFDTECVVKNCTFRNSNVEAFSAGYSTVAITNCVLVGNGTDADLYLYDCTSAIMAYSAFGKIDGTLTEDVMNLSNRVASAIYDGDSLRLNGAGFNPVAAFGLEQTGYYDFDSVEYGSLKEGYSMGAYETNCAPIYVHVQGDKVYDGNTSSNGVAQWVWTLLDENGNGYDYANSCTDLATNDAQLAEIFVVTNWNYGAADVGTYSSTFDAPNNITANVSIPNETLARWITLNVIRFTYDGEITRRDAANLIVILEPSEYAWTGDRVNAKVTVKDDCTEEVLTEGVDYNLSYADNVEPTASAKAIVEGLRNYENSKTELYLITAYYVEFTYDGEVDEDKTKIFGETSGVDVVWSEIPAPARTGYVFDYYNSPTNGVVRKYSDADGLLHLQVQYCTDSNDDKVPDKYQRQIQAKVINGEWNTSTNGADQTLWVTLWSDGKWSADGSGTITNAPAAGANYKTGFAAGEWLAFVDGHLTNLTSAAALTVTNNTVPFILYAYKRATSGASGRGGFGGRGGSTGTTTATSVLDQYKAAMTIEDFTFSGTTLTIKVGLVVTEAASGTVVKDVNLDDTALKVYVAEQLGDDWQEATGVTVDGDGNYTVDLKGVSGFYKVGL